VVRPRLERLEDRSLPSGFAVSAGGTGADAGLAVAADRAGDVYVAGYLSAAGATFDAITHEVHLSSAGGTDGFVAKYNPDGQLLWAVSLGGQYDDQATAIAVDPLGDVYVTGFINRTFQLDTPNSPVQFGAPLNQLVLPGAATAYFGNAFVARLNPDGAVGWVKELDSNAYGVGGTGIAVNDADEAYVTGNFTGTVDFGQGHVLTTPTLKGSSFVLKLDGLGNTVWADQVADIAGAGATGIALDRSDGTVYTIGGFQGHADFGGGVTLDTSNANDGAIYLSKMTADGGVLWARAMAETPGTSGTGGTAIAVDDQGDAYTTGTFSGLNVNFAPGVAVPNNANLLSSNAGSLDVFVAKHDAAGNFVWAQRAGGAGTDIGTSIAVDHSGTVYAGGFFSGQPGFFGNFFLPASGNGNSYVAELSPDGTVLTAVASQYLSPNADREFGITVDANGFADITGAFGAQAQFDTMTKAGTLPPLTSAGDNDVFVAHLQPVRPPIDVKVIDGHILQLTGDANLIAITDDRHWGILVAVDGASPLLFGTAIDKVVVDTGNANDTVQVTLAGPDTFGDPLVRPADLEVHLGNGTDTFQVNASNGWFPVFFPVFHPWHIDVTGGAGVETASFHFGGQMSSVDLEDQLAEKKNTAEVTVTPSGTPTAFPVFLKMNFLGMGGTDSIHALIGAQEPGAPDRVLLDAAVNLQFVAGADRGPTLSVDYRNVTIAAPQVLSLTGVQRDATLLMTLTNVLADAPLAVDLSSPGGDTASSSNTFGDVGHMPVPLDGALRMTDRSGPFADDIRVTFDFTPLPGTSGTSSGLHRDVEFDVPRGDPWSALVELTA
jgi:hypothetical protein